MVLTISVIVFTSIIIIVLVKANKKARRIDLATWRRAQTGHEEEDPAGQQPLTRRITAASESKCTTVTVANAAIYDEIVKVENIAYDKPVIETDTNKEHVYALIYISSSYLYTL